MKYAIPFAGLIFAASSFPAFAAAPAHPGTLNFIEGQVSVNGDPVTPNSIGSADLSAGSVLRTGSGSAEVLLTPGVFLRVGNNSEIRMLQPGLTDTRVAVDRGSAMLEAAEVHKENHIEIANAGLATTVLKNGLYRFDADQPAVQVFDGKAEVREGDRTVKVGKGKEVTPSQTPLKAQKFDRDAAKKDDPLYEWSSLRSEYLAESAAATAQTVIVNPGMWYGPGWYWNTWWGGYTWLPGSGIWASPFGYSFYSPWSFGYAPVYGYLGHPIYHRPIVGRSPGRATVRPVTPSVRMSPGTGMRSFGGFRGMGGVRGGTGGVRGGMGRGR